MSESNPSRPVPKIKLLSPLEKEFYPKTTEFRPFSIKASPLKRNFPLPYGFSNSIKSEGIYFFSKFFFSI
jgi:hypothetical protein